MKNLSEQPQPTKLRSYTIRQTAVIILLGLSLSLFFNSAGLYNWANRLPLGKTRDFLLYVIEPLHTCCRRLQLTIPVELLAGWFHGITGLQPELQTTGQPANTPHPHPAGSPVPSDPVSEKQLPETTREPAVESKWPSPAEVSPLRVLMIGDSMVGGALAPAFSKSVRNSTMFHFQADSKLSSGLSRPDYFDWPARAAWLLRQNNYDLIIVMLGMNDAQSITDQSKVYRYGTQQWFTIYGNRVRHFLALLTENCRRIYWLGIPVMRQEYYSKRMQQLNGIYRAACTESVKAAFVSSTPILYGTEGAYAQYLQVNRQLVKVRSDDGKHFTQAGAGLVVKVLRQQIDSDFNIVKPAGGQ